MLLTIIMTIVMMTIISAMMMITKYSLPTIDFATRYSTRYSDFLLQPYSNPTRSKKSLLVGAWSQAMHTLFPPLQRVRGSGICIIYAIWRSDNLTVENLKTWIKGVGKKCEIGKCEDDDVKTFWANAFKQVVSKMTRHWQNIGVRFHNRAQKGRSRRK